MQARLREQEQATQQEPAPQDTAEVAAGERKTRVLLVEDDPDMRRLVAWELRKAGYQVIEGATGVGLLAGIECSTWSNPTDTFDVVVSDIQMPDLTALEVLECLRLRDHAAPIVLMTAYGNERTRNEARALGAVEILDKPLDWTRLRAAVERAVAAR
jgi:two-component system response regulator AtoC